MFGLGGGGRGLGQWEYTETPALRTVKLSRILWGSWAQKSFCALVSCLKEIGFNQPPWPSLQRFNRQLIIKGMECRNKGGALHKSAGTPLAVQWRRHCFHGKGHGLNSWAFLVRELRSHRPWESEKVKLLSRVRLCDPMNCKPTRLLGPWNFPGKGTGVDCHFLLQGIFPTQGSNSGLLHCRQSLYHLSHPWKLTTLNYYN